MTNQIKRRPVKHFFIMERVQKTFILKTIITVCSVSLLSLLSVVLVYYIKYQSGYFYYMTECIDADLIRHSIWDLILPSAGTSLLASILVGTYIAFYASRIIALPLFKIKNWASSMFAGDLNYEVSLRKGDDLFELATSCKQISRKYNEIFRDIKAVLENKDKNSDQKTDALKEYISQFKIV